LSDEHLAIKCILAWLKMHTSGIKMRYEAMGWETDLGYIRACECIHSKIQRLLEEIEEDEEAEL
jgi:hypothetical protein